MCRRRLHRLRVGRRLQSCVFWSCVVGWVVSASSNLGFSASTTASSQMLLWWLPNSRALANALLSCAWILMTCANKWRFGDARSTSKCFRGTFDDLTLELAKCFDLAHIEKVVIGGLSRRGKHASWQVSGTAFSSSMTASATCHCCETKTCQRLRPRLRLSILPLQHGHLLLRAVESQGADTDDGLPSTAFSHPSDHTCKCLCVFPFRLIGHRWPTYSTGVRYPVRLRNPFGFSERIVRDLQHPGHMMNGERCGPCPSNASTCKGPTSVFS